MELSVLEGRQKEVNLDDIASRMGFNPALKLAHACPYIVTVSAEVDCFDILLGEIYKLKTAEAFVFQLMESKVKLFMFF